MWIFTFIKYFIIIYKFIICLFKTINNVINYFFNYFNKNKQINLKIISTGVYFPKKYLTNNDLIKIIDCDQLSIINKNNIALDKFITDHYGVSGRYFSSDDETHSIMGFNASMYALSSANLKFTDIDCVIYASAGMDKLIPDTSVYIHQKLSEQFNHSIHNPSSFTIHSSCLSFLHALEIANSFIKSNQYNTIMIISSEKMTMIADACDPKICTTIGDMSTAIIVGKSTQSVQSAKYTRLTKLVDNTSQIIKSKFKTYSKKLSDNITIDFGTINLLNKRKNNQSYTIDDFVLKTKNNKELIATIPLMILDFGNDFVSNYDYVVINQSSKIFVDYMKKIFGSNIFETFESVGNCGSCNIPYNLHKLFTLKKIKRGSKLLLIGTAAGYSVGLIELIY